MESDGGSQGGPRTAVCKVDGCFREMSREKAYFRRYNVCETHLKSLELCLDGRLQRFCQQCSKFHDVTAFDGTRRSCREQLAKHSMRRRVKLAQRRLEKRSHEGEPDPSMPPADSPSSSAFQHPQQQQQLLQQLPAGSSAAAHSTAGHWLHQLAALAAQPGFLGQRADMPAQLGVTQHLSNAPGEDQVHAVAGRGWRDTLARSSLAEGGSGLGPLPLNLQLQLSAPVGFGAPGLGSRSGLHGGYGGHGPTHGTKRSTRAMAPDEEGGPEYRHPLERSASAYEPGRQSMVGEGEQLVLPPRSVTEGTGDVVLAGALMLRGQEEGPGTLTQQLNLALRPRGGSGPEPQIGAVAQGGDTRDARMAYSFDQPSPGVWPTQQQQVQQQQRPGGAGGSMHAGSAHDGFGGRGRAALAPTPAPAPVGMDLDARERSAAASRAAAVFDGGLQLPDSVAAGPAGPSPAGVGLGLGGGRVSASGTGVGAGSGLVPQARSSGIAAPRTEGPGVSGREVMMPGGGAVDPRPGEEGGMQFVLGRRTARELPRGQQALEGRALAGAPADVPSGATSSRQFLAGSKMNAAQDAMLEAELNSLLLELETGGAPQLQRPARQDELLQLLRQQRPAGPTQVRVVDVRQGAARAGAALCAGGAASGAGPGVGAVVSGTPGASGVGGGAASHTPSSYWMATGGDHGSAPHTAHRASSSHFDGAQGSVLSQLRGSSSMPVPSARDLGPAMVPPPSLLQQQQEDGQWPHSFGMAQPMLTDAGPGLGAPPASYITRSHSDQPMQARGRVSARGELGASASGEASSQDLSGSIASLVGSTTLDALSLKSPTIVPATAAAGNTAPPVALAAVWDVEAAAARAAALQSQGQAPYQRPSLGAPGLPPNVLQAAAGAAAGPQAALQRLSLKLYDCSPEDLHPDARTQLQAWLRTMDTTMLQLTVQSGCAHLIMDLLVGTGGTSGEKAGGADCVEAGPTDGRSVVASGTVFPALKGTPPPQQQQQQPTVDPFLDTNTGTSLVSTSDLGPPLGYALASGSNSGLHTRQASRDAGMSTTSSLSLEPTPTAASTQQMEQQRLLLQQVQLPDKAPADTGGVVWKRLMDGGLHELLQALRGGGGGEQGLSAAGDGRGGADSPIGDSKTQRVLLQFEDKVVCCAARGLRDPAAALEHGPGACGGLPPLLPAPHAATPVATELSPGPAMQLPVLLWVSPPAIAVGVETELLVAVADGEDGTWPLSWGPILLHLRCGSVVLSHRLSELQEATPPVVQPPQPAGQAPYAAVRSPGGPGPDRPEPVEAEAKGAVEACGYWTAAGRNALVPRRATAEDGKVVIPVVNMNEDQGPEARVLQFRVPATTLPRPGLAFLETSCCELLGPWLPLLVLPSEAAATEVSELVRAHGADRVRPLLTDLGSLTPLLGLAGLLHGQGLTEDWEALVGYRELREAMGDAQDVAARALRGCMDWGMAECASLVGGLLLEMLAEDALEKEQQQQEEQLLSL